MTVEIKTLKELEVDCHWHYDTLKELKQAAREWVKELEKMNSSRDYGPEKYQLCTSEIGGGDWTCENIVKWIEHFFNLGDEK